MTFIAEHSENGQGSPSCVIYVGASGYSYNEWVEAGFYPPGTKSSLMLPLYARKFKCVELNYTWYRMPDSQTIQRQLEMVSPEFMFSAKLTRILTHEVDEKNWASQADEYRAGIAPLFQAGQLAAVLAQFPPSFSRSIANRKYLASLLDSLEGLPLAVEFRNRSWAVESVFKGLEARGVTLAGVDEPALPGLFPALGEVTNSGFFYLRFHGRNTRGWRTGNLGKQFDYSYSDDELMQWIEEKIQPMSARAARGLVFFNNHVRGQAVENAGRMKEMLSGQGLEVL